MPLNIRSFIAFDIDNEGILKRMIEVQKKLAATGANIKLVKPANIHITLRFLGNIQPNMIEKTHTAMEKLTFTSFEARIRGLGAFPTLKYPRIIWAGIKEGAEKLNEITSQLQPRLQSLGFSPDAKGFSPHITIARVRTGRNRAELSRCITELKSYEFGALRVECLKLKKSVLTPNGPVYSTLREVCR